MDPSETVWECLNAGTVDGTSQLEYFRVSEIEGVEIWHENGAEKTTLKTTPLQAGSVKSWLEERNPNLNQQRPVIRLLLCEQLCTHDKLDAETADPTCPSDGFPRSLITEHFKLPPVALREASQGRNWLIDIPEAIGTRHTFRGISTRRFCTVWHCDADTSLITGFAAFYRGGRTSRDFYLQMLQYAARFARDVDPVPFAIANIIERALSARLTGAVEAGEIADHSILKHLGNCDAHEMFFGTAARAANVAIHRRELRLLLEVTEWFMNPRLHRPSWTPGNSHGRGEEDRRRREQITQSLMGGMEYLRRRARTMLEDCDIYLEQTNRQISMMMNMISQREQTIGIEIAQASKSIAQESKRDSSSMKTLAVATMIYLPGTSVAAIFAMPMFDWTAPASRIVNPRIWVFFCVSLPLTILTFLAWRSWFTYGDKRQTKQENIASRIEKGVEKRITGSID